jgi:tetratricopeptide (TPR) repeat protein
MMCLQDAFQVIRHDVWIRVMPQNLSSAPSFFDGIRRLWRFNSRGRLSRDGTIAESYASVPPDVSPPSVAAEAYEPPPVAVSEVETAPERSAAEHLAEARALQAAGQYEQADATIRAAQDAFPDDVDVSFTCGLFAFGRRDWPEAQRRWTDMRARFPEHPAGYTFGARSFSEAGDADVAEDLIEQALLAFPRDGGVLCAWAELPMRRQDWVAAIQRWAVMRERLPHQIEGYLRGAAALRAAQRCGEAESLLQDAMEQFPDNATPVVDHAQIALDRRDWPEAQLRCEALRSRHPGHPFGYTSGALALQASGDVVAADDIMDQAVRSVPADVEVLSTWADRAMRRRDWEVAIERWATMRDRLPNHILGYLQGAAALREAQRDAEADRLLRDTTQRFPANLEAAVDFARIAHTQRRWPDADTRWALLQARFPGNPVGWCGAALSAREAGQTDEEDRILRATVQRFPDEYGVAAEFALHPMRAQDWPEMLRRWQQVKSRFPALPACDAFIALALRQMGRVDEAAAVLTAAMERFPGDLHPLMEAARLAQHNRDWPQALDRWNAVRQASPESYDALLMTALALRELRRFDEADAVLKQAMERFPAEVRGFFDFGMVALIGNDPAAAFARLRDALQRFPNDIRIRNQMLIARERMAELDQDGEDAVDGRLDLSVDDSLASIAPGLSKDVLRSIFCQFESLGGLSIGCEFGAVQRAFGADPLGLLRWSLTFPPKLAEALETRFEGMGLPENIDLRISDKGDYRIREKRFGTAMHTFVDASDVPFEQMMLQTSRRLQFLRSKLISDLEAGEKIFVYKFDRYPLADEEISRLHQAVRSYGDGVLLLVQRSDEAHATETVELRAPGLMVGYLDRFAEPGIYDPSPAWGALCLKAHRLWQDSLAPTSAMDAPASGDAALELQS